MRAAWLTLALTACTPAQRSVGLAAAGTALLAYDWHATAGLTLRCLEANPIIGECGDGLSPHFYFPTVMIANVLVGVAVGKSWRESWFAAVTGAEAAVAWTNSAQDP